MRVRATLFVGLLGLCHCKESKPDVPAPATPPSAAGSTSPSPSAVTSAAAAAPRHSGPRKTFASAPAVVAVAGAADTADAGAPGAVKPTVTPASVGLPTVDFGPPGPLVLKGYPQPIGSGMDDPATVFGYSQDGSEVIACGHMGAGYSDGPPKGSELGDRCYFAGPTGPTRHIAVEETRVQPAFAEKLTALKSGTPTHLAKGVGVLPPAVATSWPFAKDLTLQVTSDGALRVGGKVGTEDPVYPVTVSVKAATPELQYGGSWNGILVSPDRTELAFIGHFFCMEWCNEIAIARLPFGKLASLVFNDTGFRHHQKKDYAGSRDLFLKATWADPTAPLPPYNLACAYALSNDAVNAEKALKLAIAVGGPRVKARAVKDADFKAVLAAKWFVDLTK